MNERERSGLVPREGWAPGPWNEEPDRVEWVDEATRYPCLVVRHYTDGFLCGYVAVPPHHPLHGVSWGNGATTELVAHHGGINYSAPCMDLETVPREVEPPPGMPELLVCHVPEPGQAHDVWWFGFHCGHSWDLQPGLEARMRELDERLGLGIAEREAELPEPLRPTYRPMAYVRHQCTQLAAQLAEMAR